MDNLFLSATDISNSRASRKYNHSEHNFNHFNKYNNNNNNNNYNNNSATTSVQLLWEEHFWLGHRPSSIALVAPDPDDLSFQGQLEIPVSPPLTNWTVELAFDRPLATFEVRIKRNA